MKTITIFVADDGERFTTVEECIAYEKKVKNLPPSIRFLDSTFQDILKRTEDYTQDDIFRAFNSAAYTQVLDTPEYIEDLKFMRFYWGLLSEIGAPGLYKYDDDENEWVLVEEEVK